MNLKAARSEQTTPNAPPPVGGSAAEYVEINKPIAEVAGSEQGCAIQTPLTSVRRNDILRSSLNSL